MASQLAEKNIPTALIPECAIYAMMSRVNKVLLGNFMANFYKIL